MTSLTKHLIDCPKCHNKFSIVYEASITTWLSPKLVNKFLNDEYFYSCSHCQQNIHFIHTMIINCPKGMFTMETDTPFDQKRAKLIEYGVLDAEGKDISRNYLFKRINEGKDEHYRGGDQKKNCAHLKTMIFNFHSVLRSKKFKEISFDYLDWSEYDKITLNIKEELERDQENYYLHPPGEKMIPLEEDEPLMEKWGKIKEIMSHLQRPT